MTQQTCLLRDAPDMSVVRHGKHVCCVTQQICLLCATTEMSAVSDGRHVCCVTQQTCLLCETADMSSVSHSRHVHCVTQLDPPKKVIPFFRASATQPSAMQAFKALDSINHGMRLHVLCAVFNYIQRPAEHYEGISAFTRVSLVARLLGFLRVLL